MDYVIVTYNTAPINTYMQSQPNISLLLSVTKYLFWIRTGMIEADLTAMTSSGNLRAWVSLAYLEGLV